MASWHRFLTAVVWLILFSFAGAAESTTVSQYGVTWTFSQPRQVGQFITGDWWVAGPVTVVKVDPASGPDRGAGNDKTVKSRYGATGLIDNQDMRNGSMIVAQSGNKQGYDSRLPNYEAALTLSFPLTVQPGQTLISSISNTTNPNPVLLKDIMWKGESSGSAALQSAAMLTCLDAAPPDDAFRPPYAGTDRPLFRARQIAWAALPHLEPVGVVPSWAMVERWFERPWIDHTAGWVFQLTGPQQNQANYGREFCRANAIAGLMLMLNVPQEQKRTLLVRFIQRGIDCYGLIKSGRRWSADGGHWNGRKFPLLFAAIVLDDQRLSAALAEGLFSEDQQTYYGTGFFGDTALYQMVWHTGPRPPFEEKDPKTWDAGDKRSAGYRRTCSVGWPGQALGVLLLKGKAAWNHDAYFDYVDRWMADPQSGGLPGNGKCDAFVQAMWDAYRPSVPAQPDGNDNRMWDWQKREFGPNEKPKH